jgi:cytoskeletal protein CcmA (bactofilin family)
MPGEQEMPRKEEPETFLSRSKILSSIMRRVRPEQSEPDSKEGNMFERKERSVEAAREDERAQSENLNRKPAQKANTILKGSKLVGNITITQDLELTGDVEGDITSEEDSRIVIKGTCKGNIRTRGGSVEIEGEMTEGDIIAGDYVRITGKFNGGKIEAREKIYINGGFSGKLESKEIEVGPSAHGKGELYYKESVSIEKGAKVEGQIVHVQEQKKEARRPAGPKVVELEQPRKGEVGS